MRPSRCPAPPLRRSPSRSRPRRPRRSHRGDAAFRRRPGRGLNDPARCTGGPRRRDGDGDAVGRGPVTVRIGRGGPRSCPVRPLHPTPSAPIHRVPETVADPSAAEQTPAPQAVGAHRGRGPPGEAGAAQPLPGTPAAPESEPVPAGAEAATVGDAAFRRRPGRGLNDPARCTGGPRRRDGDGDAVGRGPVSVRIGRGGPRSRPVRPLPPRPRPHRYIASRDPSPIPRTPSRHPQRRPSERTAVVPPSRAVGRDAP